MNVNQKAELIKALQIEISGFVDDEINYHGGTDMARTMEEDGFFEALNKRIAKSVECFTKL